jgi:glycosyltransferase involved in cell wall biosynthesis
MGMFAANVGVFCPYRHVEATYCACSLAQTLRKMGYDPTLITADQRGNQVHYAYDRDIRTLSRATIEACGINQQNMVWFAHQPKLLKKLRHAEPAQRHVLVLSRDQFVYDPHSLRDYSAVVCTRSDVYESAMLWRRRHSDMQRPISLLWESELPIANRRIIAPSAPLRMLVVFDNRTTRIDKQLTAIKELLSKEANLQVTLWHTTPWDKQAHKAIIVLRRAFIGRFLVERHPDALRRNELFRQHDFAWFASPQYDHAPLIADALASHCPVIGYDIPPISDLIIDGQNGALLRCRRVRGTLGVMSAKLDDEELYSALRRYIKSNDLARHRSTEWTQLESRRRDFHTKWTAILEGEAIQDDDY